MSLKKWVQLKKSFSRNKLKPNINGTKGIFKQIFGSSNIDEYPIVTTFAKTAYIIPAENAWPERDGSRINWIKANKISALKSESDALNALIKISINDPQRGAHDKSYLIFNTEKTFGYHHHIRQIYSQTQQNE